MNEFMLLFHSAPYSAEQMQASIPQWQDWMGGIAAQGIMTGANRLAYDGHVVKPGHIVTDGPYVETKEMLGGYIIVKADNLAHAVELSKGCPVFSVGGNVEVRPIIPR